MQAITSKCKKEQKRANDGSDDVREIKLTMWEKTTLWWLFAAEVRKKSNKWWRWNAGNCILIVGRFYELVFICVFCLTSICSTWCTFAGKERWTKSYDLCVSDGSAEARGTKSLLEKKKRTGPEKQLNRHQQGRPAGPTTRMQRGGQEPEEDDNRTGTKD